jgi:hypothetical protein
MHPESPRPGSEPLSDSPQTDPRPGLSPQTNEDALRFAPALSVRGYHPPRNREFASLLPPVAFVSGQIRPKIENHPTSFAAVEAPGAEECPNKGDLALPLLSLVEISGVEAPLIRHPGIFSVLGDSHQHSGVCREPRADPEHRDEDPSEHAGDSREVLGMVTRQVVAPRLPSSWPWCERPPDCPESAEACPVGVSRLGPTVVTRARVCARVASSHAHPHRERLNRGLEEPTRPPPREGVPPRYRGTLPRSESHDTLDAIRRNPCVVGVSDLAAAS